MAIIDSVKLPDNSTYEVADNHSGYAKKVAGATTDDLASLTATGDLADSGKKLSDLVLKSDVKDVLNSTSTTDPLSANQGRVLAENLSHENLLLNPWFTVNQRDFITGNFINLYCVDMWQRSYGSYTTGSVTVTSNGITLDRTVINDTGYLTQILENLELGKTYTISCIVDGTLYEATGNISTTSDSLLCVFPNGKGAIALIYSSAAWYVVVSVYGNQSFTIRAVKLELGSVSTLANDVEPNHTTELLKCQREFYRKISKDNTNAYIASGICTSSNGFIFTMKLPCEMKSAPSISAAGSFYITNGLINVAVTSFSVSGFSGDTMGVIAITAGGLTTGDAALIYANNIGDYIDFTT